MQNFFCSDVNHEMSCMVGVSTPYSRSLYQGTLFTRGLFVFQDNFFFNIMNKREGHAFRCFSFFFTFFFFFVLYFVLGCPRIFQSKVCY